MAGKRSTVEHGRKAGMWSTITLAIQSGWAATARLLLIFLFLGVFFVIIAAGAGDNALTVVLRFLVAGGRL